MVFNYEAFSIKKSRPPFSQKIVLHCRKAMLYGETRFKEGQFPLLYLGVPVVQGGLSSGHLESLIGKI